MDDEKIMMKEQPQKFYVDVIRAYAICAIFGFHIADLLNIPFDIWGVAAVYLFYMISGNGLFGAYGKEINYQTFYKKRFLKIYPTFWLCYLLVFAVHCAQHRTWSNVPKYRFLLSILGIDGFFLYRNENFYLIGEWFLGSILFLYLFFPLVRICVLKNKNLTLGILFGCSCLIFYNNCFGMFQIFAGRNLIVGCFFFVLGICMDEIYGKIKQKKWIYGYGVLTVVYVSFVFQNYDETPLLPAFGGLLLISTFAYLFFMNVSKYLEARNSIVFIVKCLSRNSYVIFLLHHQIMENTVFYFPKYQNTVSGKIYLILLCVFFTAVAVCLVNQVKRFGGFVKRNILRDS